MYTHVKLEWVNYNIIEKGEKFVLYYAYVKILYSFYSRHLPIRLKLLGDCKYTYMHTNKMHKSYMYTYSLDLKQDARINGQA